MRPLFRTALLVVTSAYLVSAQAQNVNQGTGTWQEKMDKLTAGAAASVVSFQICEDADAATKAANDASDRLAVKTRLYTNQDVGSDTIWDYARDAYGIKVRAFLASNAGASCAQVGRLRELAASTGFKVPPAQ